MAKFSKKNLRVFFGGLHQIIAAACFFFFTFSQIAPNLSISKLLLVPITRTESQNHHYGNFFFFAFFLVGNFF